MAFGAIVPAALGSVTAGASLTLATPASVETGLVPWGLWDAIHIPSINTVLLCHGAEAMREYLEGAVYRVGIIAPADGMTAVSTAVKATRVATFTGATNAAAVPADGDLWQIGKTGVDGNGYVYWKTTLDTTSPTDQILRGANADAAIANLTAFLNGTGTNGTEYYGGRAILSGYDPQTVWDERNGIELSSSQAYGVPSATTATATVRALIAGTGGNSYLSIVTIGTTTSFPGGTFTGGAAGTGTAPSSGEYTYALGVGRVADGTLSGIQPTLVTMEQSGNFEVSAANYPTPAARDDTDFYRLYRTLVGRKVLYKEEDSTATSATDSAEDDDLVALGSYKYDERIFRSRFNGYPEIRRFGAIWRGRFWKGGIHRSADYAPSAAAVAVTNASATADFSGSTGRPQEDWLGGAFP